MRDLSPGEIAAANGDGTTEEGRPVSVGLWPLSAYFLRLGATGFGGPIALAGFMQRDLVEERRWVTREEYLDGLALAQLAPGPLAAQLAMYLGYVRGGVVGATAVAVAFILPSFLMVWALSAAYVHFGGLSWMQGAFYGVGAAVIGIIARSVLKLARLTIAGPLLWSIFAVMAVTTAWTQREIEWLFLLAGTVTAWVRWQAERSTTDTPSSASAALAVVLATGGALPAAPSTASIFWLFVKAGAFVFGSGLAIVPFLYGELVEARGWLTDRQFLDAVAVAMITPGPVVITVGFIGYLVAGTWGMTVAALGVFLPVYVFVVAPAPYFRRYRDLALVKGFVEGVSAAASGAIAGAAVVLAQRALTDATTVLLALATLVILSRWRLSELWLIGAAAGVGLVLR